MANRIMSKVAGRERPLSFDSRGSAPWLAGSSTSWAGLPIEAHRIRSFETFAEAGPLDGECGLLVITDGRLEIAARHGGRDVRNDVAAGTTLLVSGDDRATRVRMTGQADAVAVHLPTEWFRRLSIDEVPAGFARAPERPARIRPRPRAALGDLSVTELAAQVGRRPRHFSTLFRRAFGESPHQYLLRLRLAEGARLLASGTLDVAGVAGVAFRVGFCSQSHFTAAFRRAYGVSPARYAGEKRAVS